MVGYRKHYYGIYNDSNSKQCFNCKYGKCIENDREKIQCNRWNMITSEDDVCDDFDWSTYWAFVQTEEDWERRRKKLDMRRNGLSTIEENTIEYSRRKNTVEEKDITTAQFVAIGSLLGGTMFNLVFAFIAYNTSLMEWGIQQWFFTYVVAVIIVGIGNFLLGILSKDL